MDKKSRLKAELQLTEAGREFLEDVELPKHTNPLSSKVNGKVEPYKKVNTIIIPEGATNGDMIKAMFPNLIITVCSEAKPIPYVMVIGENYEYNLTYPLDWWNTPYKKEVEE